MKKHMSSVSVIILIIFRVDRSKNKLFINLMKRYTDKEITIINIKSQSKQVNYEVTRT